MGRINRSWFLIVAGVMLLVGGAGRTHAQEAGAKTIAVTVDDLPGQVPGTGQSQGALKDFQKINAAVPQILKAHHVPAIGFVNE